jgi:hypothetical protein
MENINGKSGSGTGCLSAIALNGLWFLLAVLAIFLGWRSYTLSVNGEVAQGIVVRWVEEDVSSSFTDIYPVVEFEVDGQTYSVRSQNNYSWWNKYTRFPIGKQVGMRYDPLNPEKAEIDSVYDIWMEPVILGIFTIVAIVVTNAFFINRWRAGRNTKADAR